MIMSLYFGSASWAQVVRSSSTYWGCQITPKAMAVRVWNWQPPSMTAASSMYSSASYSSEQYSRICPCSRMPVQNVATFTDTQSTVTAFASTSWLIREPVAEEDRTSTRLNSRH